MSTQSSRPALVDHRLTAYDDLRNAVQSLYCGDQLTIETSDYKALLDHRHVLRRSVQTLEYLKIDRRTPHEVPHGTLLLSNSTDQVHILPSEYYPVQESTPMKVEDWMERVSILAPLFKVNNVLDDAYQWANVPIYNFPKRLRVEFTRPRLLGFVSFKLTHLTGDRVLRRPLFASANPAIAVTSHGDEFVREAEGWVPRSFIVTAVPGTSVFLKGGA